MENNMNFEPKLRKFLRKNKNILLDETEKFLK